MNIFWENLHITDPENKIEIVYEDGLWVALETSEVVPNIPYFIVYYGPREDRHDCFISALNPEYISDIGKMSSKYIQRFIEVIQDKWDMIKSTDPYKDLVPDQAPDYSKLETV